MSASKRRLKARADRTRRKATKMEGFKRKEGEPPSDRTSYGKRWNARRRGEPMAARSMAPWWMPMLAAWALFSGCADTPAPLMVAVLAVSIGLLTVGVIAVVVAKVLLDMKRGGR